MRQSRWPIVIVLIVALIATGFTRQLAADHRTSSGRVGVTATGPASQSLSRMNSFALALLLGGLRGPLVMFLWSNSESQKADKDLEGVDTQIEWIRLLQPEFDSVHIFQIWNKAYNLSAQMASLSNKYLTIIDAIEYAKKVDAERPDDINIVYATGGIYGDKLGDSNEKLYYNRRVRAESLPHESRQKLSQSDPGYRRLQLDAMLDRDGNLLPATLVPSGVFLQDKSHPEDVYDGSELYFLKQFQPYPYGLSPSAIGYAYRKRAQLLARLGNQKHSQLSDLVVDSRPALDLKKWAETEWDAGRRCETRAFGAQVTAEEKSMEASTQEIGLNVHIDDTTAKPLIQQAIYSYDLATKLIPAAESEYAHHLELNKQNFELYSSHRDEIASLRPMLEGDRDFLKALLLPVDQRGPLLESAKKAYDRSIVRHNYLLLRYYIPEQIEQRFFPPGVTRTNLSETVFKTIESVSSDATSALVQRCLPLIPEGEGEDVQEFITYIRRASARIDHIGR